MSGGLLSQDALARMAAVLLTRAQTRLVIRAGVDYVSGEFPHIGFRRRISIYLLSFCSKGGREGFFEVRYTSDDDPAGWYKAEFKLKPLYTRGSGSPELYLEPHPDLVTVQGQLALWELLFPPFVSDKEVVVGFKDQRRNYSTWPNSDPRLMLHYARLYGWLEKLPKSEGLSWVAETFLKRLGAFLAERAKDWERVIG